MFTIFQSLYQSLPNIFTTLIFVGFIWGLCGWFYVHILGKETHDFIVFSVLGFIVFLIFSLLTNPFLQTLFFGR